MTRKEFVLQIVNDLKENPKAVLRGHGLKAPLLQQLSEREDILSKFAAFAYSTVYATKGKKALQKQAGVGVFAYKNFLDFNANARQDVQSFMETLSEEDQATFTNKNNIVVMLALPDAEDAGTEGNISNGKSVMLNFDSAVKKEYKIASATYYVIMYGDSAIRKAEASKAEAKAKVNEKTVARTKSPQKVKAELIRKAKAKMAALQNKNKRLASSAARVQAQLGEVNAYAKQLGLNPQQARPGDITAAQRQFNKRTTAGSKVLKDARLDVHQREINTIRMRNRILVQKLQDAPTAKEKANIRFAINKNRTKIEQLKARMGVYEDLSATAIKSKARVLAQINSEIEANLAMGQTITDSLNSALQTLNVPAQQKQQMAQQVIQDIANNQSSLQLATQQVLQEQLPAQVKMQTPQQFVPKPAKKGRKTKSLERLLNTPSEPVFGDDFVGDDFSDVMTAQKAPQFSKSQEIQKVLSFI